MKLSIPILPAHSNTIRMPVVPMSSADTKTDSEKGTVALTIFLVNRQSLSHGIENSQPLSISAQEQIMIFGQHKTEALFPASEF